MLLPADTPNLHFRRWTAGDGPLAESLWCDEAVMRFMGGVLTPVEAQARLAGEIARGAETGLEYWPMHLRNSNTFAGCAGLRPWVDAPTEPGLLEVGVHLMRSAWGRRLGEEALHTVLRHGFETLGLHTIVAGHGLENLNSQRMIERNGFQHTHNGIWALRSLHVRWYRLTADGWRSHQAPDPGGTNAENAT